MPLDNIKISSFVNIFDTDNPYVLDLFDVLDLIKHPQPEIKKVVSEVRNAPASRRSDLKVKILPGVCFSGTFSKREDAALINYNPIVCLDLDDVTDITSEMDKLKQYPFVLAAFLSPTATGIKVVCYHDSNDPSYHKELYWKLGEELGSTGRSDLKFDLSCSNVSRFCFLSMDPKAYINKNAEPYHFDPACVPTITTKLPSTPISNVPTQKASIADYRAIRKQIQETHSLFEEHYAMYPGTRNQHLFILASFLKSDGIPESIVEDYLSVYYTDSANGFGEDEIRKTVKSAYC